MCEYAEFIGALGLRKLKQLEVDRLQIPCLHREYMFNEATWTCFETHVAFAFKLTLEIVLIVSCCCFLDACVE